MHDGDAHRPRAATGSAVGPTTEATSGATAEPAGPRSGGAGDRPEDDG